MVAVIVVHRTRAIAVSAVPVTMGIMMLVMTAMAMPMPMTGMAPMATITIIPVGLVGTSVTYGIVEVDQRAGVVMAIRLMGGGGSDVQQAGQ